MDQLRTTEADLYERLFPSKDLAYWLGQVLNYPVSNLPTVEDYEREQGHIGLPTEVQSSREAGQGALDYLTMAYGLVSALKSGGTGVQELMGKRRGVETFGKEMMDTSRRAQGQRWQDMEAENWRPIGEPEGGLATGRKSYEDMIRQRGMNAQPMAPGETPQWRRGEIKPQDVVERGPLTFHSAWAKRMVTEPDAYHIGQKVELPGGRLAQYVVVPGGGGYHVRLNDNGERIMFVESFPSMGEALAKARQMQNRLALAAKDFGRVERETMALPEGVASGINRDIRFPWERGLSAGHGDLWRWDYDPPPTSGRWGQ